MSIKQVLTIIILSVVAITMTAWGFQQPKYDPATDASIYGNGGMEVRKGDYVYFINGFYGIDDVDSKSNKYGNAVRGAIYRTKLVDGTFQFDEDGNLKDCDVIVPKIVGYEFGSFYIYDDYIYYATPNNEKDKYGELQKNLVDIYRCDIDGDNNKKIYTTTSEYSEVSFNVAKIKTGDKSYSTFVMIKDGAQLLTFEFVKGKDQGKTVICEENVSSVAWLQQENYVVGSDAVENLDEVNKCIYFTETKTNSSKLSSYNLITGETKVLSDDNLTTYTLKGLKNDSIYYEKKINDSTFFASNTLVGGFGSSEKIMYYNSYTNYYIMEENWSYQGGVIATNDSGTYFVKFGESGDNNRQTISNTIGYDILFVDGSKIYARNDSAQIYVIDLTDSTFTAKEILTSEVAGKSDGSKYVDFDGTYIIYYGENKVDDVSYYYTHFVDLNEVDENDLYVDKFVGKYAEGEEPAEEEE